MDPPDDSSARPAAAPESAQEQVGTTASEIRPDLAVGEDEERERTSDRGDRHRAAPDVSVADNAGRAPGSEQGTPDIGQEAGSVSEPG